jgi:hypothetical protein
MSSVIDIEEERYLKTRWMWEARRVNTPPLNLARFSRSVPSNYTRNDARSSSTIWRNNAL